MAKFTRKGLHRFQCEMCGEALYATIPAVERRGLPACWCGEACQPANIETALALGDLADDAPVMSAYRAKVSSVAHGQASHYAKGRELESPEFRAVESIGREQRKAARQRRVAALLPTPEPMMF